MTFVPTTAKEFLLCTREKLSNKDNWTRGALARDMEGKKIYTKNEHATCWCILGALDTYRTQQNFNGFIKAEEFLYQEVIKLGYSSLPDFNDSSDTNHCDVLKVLDRAISEANKDNRND